MEVNLAIFIMAVGLLAMVALYPLAYRENRQSKDDVKAAAAADCILNTLTAALSSRYIEWNDWVSGVRQAKSATGNSQALSGGWLSYCDWEANGSSGSFVPKKRDKINHTSQDVFDALAGINKRKTPHWPFKRLLEQSTTGQMPPVMFKKHWAQASQAFLVRAMPWCPV